MGRKVVSKKSRGLKLTESVHVVVVELEVEELSVGLDAVLGKGLGKDDVTVGKQRKGNQRKRFCLG